MSKRNAGLLGSIIGGLVLQSTLAVAATPARYIWSSSKGLQKTANCTVTSQDQIPLYLVEKDGRIQDGVVSTANLGGISKNSLKELSESILDLKDSSATGVIEGQQLSNTLLQAAFDDSGSDYAALLCKTSAGRSGYALFNVFAPGKEQPIAQLAISKNDAGLLSKAKVHSVEEAMKIVESRMQKGAVGSADCNCSTSANFGAGAMTMNGRTIDLTGIPTEKKSSEAQLDESDARTAAVNTSIVQQAQASANAAKSNGAQASQAQASNELAQASAAAAATTANSYVVCSPTADIRVRDRGLKKVLFNAKRLEKITLLQKLGSGKKFEIEGKTYSFIQVQFSARDQKQTGFIAEQMIKTADQCGSSSVAAAPIAVAKPAAPAPTVATASDDSDDSNINLKAPTCASMKILASAKKNVAKRWGNNPTGTGACAQGVRQSLQNSGVGGISGGIGNAIDMVGPLKARGYVEIGIRDATQIPAGAVMIFSGPLTSSYLKNHRMSRPFGNYVGHVTIKGDDGFYYTDGRTAEPALGWSKDKNVQGRRNLYAVLVPGATLVKQYAGSCK